MEQSSVGVDKEKGGKKKKKKKGKTRHVIVVFPFVFPFLLRSGPLVGTSEVRWRFSFSVYFVLARRFPSQVGFLVCSSRSTVLAPCPFRTRKS